MSVPKLRFKADDGSEFGEWEKLTLSQISKHIGGTALESYVSECGDYNFISIGNYSTNGKYIDNSQRIILNEKTGTKLLDKDDLVMVLNDKTATGDLIGSTILINEDNKYIYNQRSERIICNKSKVLSVYLWHFLNSEMMRSEVRKLAQGGTQIYINFSSVLSIIFLLPCLAEQNKIANFLSNVDEKISQLTQKHQLLSQYKQGMMQKLFSQQLRFKADDGSEFGEWEETELGKHCQIKTGKLDANAMRPNGEFRFYTCAKEFYLIDEYAFDTEALLISGNGANVGYIHYYKGKFNAYQRTYVLDQWQQNIIFIQYFLEQFLKERIYGEKKEGNTPYIVLSTLSEMPLLLPCLEEQTKIANFLSSIDQKIEVVAEQIEQAKTWKKGLLQQMFV